MRAELAERDRRIVELEGELQRLRPPPRVIKVDGPFAAPDLEQVEKLVRRVLAKYPTLDPDRTRDPIQFGDYVPMVRSGMVYLASLYRTRGKVARERSYLDWLYLCGDHLNAVSCHPTTVRGSSLFVAAIASNDVPYSPPRLWPQAADMGVAVGPGRDRYAASNRWLTLLAGGDFDSSLIVEPPQPRHAPLQPFEIMKDWRRELQRE
jgi:hypothetical protein